ncbi:DNA cytosine methyltransferase [Halomonas elongata]|uniref:DNA cytosine methyltransferase n=1 Tax=Halomonas elongata (strain ATCC 33173 / DSM 2581 / NBRC 15536 / NCIMB 2198 / 1H9) TaxID=768066 RepID=E1V366_HALED|nr:DNA cytosine methyltransferase [Halomonas elongata]WBF19838.1 DNA cytosine methyltransferase [Halomonas elongata]WPU48708.1 DNA cytosine methyltransferase [Halomonas elongata DSM 2581]CBV42545.1 DNA-cytosine methyltransferase domain protein [Halomonas elongata DSM 2581]
MPCTQEVRHFHLFCGLGGGAAGFNCGHARVGAMDAQFRCIGGVDSDPAAIADFGRLAGTPGTVLDMFDRDQYIAFHDAEPPGDWREAMPADIQAAAGGERPHIVFLSAPCKGFSGLLSQKRSTTDRYQALNRLTVRGMWLALEAWADDPPELFIFENVPRIANRGRPLLDSITAMLERYGYHVAETTHDCGEIGGLAQSRKRFLLVARHAEKVPPFLYEPVKRPLRAVGQVLGNMPLPGDELAGPMHRVPRLQWKTWVRLAFVEAGSDWRSLNRLAVEDGHLRDYLIMPEGRNGFLGVNDWEETVGTVAGASRPGNGKFSVADPRFNQSAKWKDGQAYGVRHWHGTAGAITSQKSPGQGSFAVADPRIDGVRHNNVFRIMPWAATSQAVTAGGGPTAGGLAVADPRGATAFAGKYQVTGFDESAGTVISGSTTGQGAFAVADPRPGLVRGKGSHYLTAGHYGVVPWSSSCGAVSASARQDNGSWSVADPRLPAATDKMVAVIRALDGTWHRPFTTLELAALQGLVDPAEQLELDGLNDSAWRERIGNAVPAPAAEAIAGVMGTTLLLAWAGETFALGSTPIWVRQVAAGLSLNQPDTRAAH